MQGLSLRYARMSYNVWLEDRHYGRVPSSCPAFPPSSKGTEHSCPPISPGRFLHSDHLPKMQLLLAELSPAEILNI